MATLVYVDGTLTTGLNSGTSWENAYQGCGGLQTAMNSIVNLSDTTIYIRNTFSVGSHGSMISNNARGGNYANNSWLRIIGCDSVSGNPLPKGQYVVLDGENIITTHILYINDAAMVHIENIHFTRADANGCFIISSSSLRFGYNFINCKFSYCDYGIHISSINNRNVFIGGCIFSNNISFDVFSYASMPTIIGNFFNSACPAIYALYGASVQKCLFRHISNSGTAVTITAGSSQRGEAVVTHNTFYCTGTGGVTAINCGNLTGPVITNNIMYFAEPTTDTPITFVRMSVEDYNCTNAIVHTLNGIHSLNGVDPQFVDAAGGDFRPRNPAVLRGGQPDIAGNPAQIGAIQSQYQFVSKARAANFGRGSIFK